ncbi:uncharacterized protein LOC134817592 isoform X2 [Bolinopsis microptera]|uniref:uncharacterized protein LOC134817592 isoform X2 n=1 Tax=Bolinopsis microptera TaxID=2820187 RepID=UPI003078CE5F
MKVYILSGQTELAGGRTWAVRDNFSLDGLGNDEFEDKTTALMKCIDTSNCKGVVKKNNGKFVIATKRSLKPKKHFITYTMGSTVRVYRDYTWTIMTGYRLTGYADNKTYKTLKKALRACAINDKCHGVTKEAKGKFRINTGRSPATKRGMNCYIKGGMKHSVHYMTYGNRAWSVVAPFRMNGRKLATEKTRDAAMGKCITTKGCVGITRDEQGLYHLHNGQTLIQDQGYITYLIGGQALSSNGYLWDYRYHFSLHGYDSNAQYRSASEAFAACIRSKTCVGVTQERPGHFRLNTHRVPRPHGGRECWIKGNQQVKAHSYPWVIQTNYATNWVQDKPYPTLDSAEKACAASPACKAVNRMSATEYYLAEGDGERDETGTTTYVKGGQEQDQQSFSWPALGYTWHYSAPFALGRTYRTFNTLPEAFRACVRDSRCKGITADAHQKYHLSHVGIPRPGFKAQSWVKESPYKNMYVSQRVYSTHKGARLDGYSSGQSYTALVTALEACAASTSCNGVTKEGTKRYRLNTGNSPRKVNNMDCYIKEGSFDVQNDYRFTISTGYVGVNFVDKKVYLTAEGAKSACAANVHCVGVSKLKEVEYRLNKDGELKGQKGGVVYSKDEFYTTQRIVNMDDKAYIGYSPAGLQGSKLGTAANIAKAMELCEEKHGCNGFEWNGKTYVIYHYNRMVTPKIGHVAYVYSGIKLTSENYLWAKMTNYRLTGYDDNKTYTSLSDATKACVASPTCKGVTKEFNRFRTNNNDRPVRANGNYAAYIRGDRYEVIDYIFYSEKSGYRLTGDIGKTTYKSKEEAAAACKKSAVCTGITLDQTTKKYRINSGNSLEPSVGETCVRARRYQTNSG